MGYSTRRQEFDPVVTGDTMGPVGGSLILCLLKKTFEA